MSLYPLKFYEIYKPKIWGGDAIGARLGKNLVAGARVGESWELCDHFDDVSVVRNGPLEGRTLRRIWHDSPEELLGPSLAARGYAEFPLLVKFIDAAKMLSVQVHPDESYAARQDPTGESGKNEAWYILAAAPGAQLVAGLKSGTSRDTFEKLLGSGSIEECLNYVDVSPGDVVHISAGTVHAVGPGILFCEVQQSSDATYRIWDWDRPGCDGKRRPLHIDDALNVIDFDLGPVAPRKHVSTGHDHESRLVVDDCPFFRIERIDVSEPVVETEPHDRFSILVCLAGQGGIVCEGERYSYALGDTLLLPAALAPARIEPARISTFLKVYIP